jgi:hypothetical protein
VKNSFSLPKGVVGNFALIISRKIDYIRLVNFVDQLLRGCKIIMKLSFALSLILRAIRTERRLALSF